MYETISFSIALVFCFGTWIISAKEGNEIDLIKSLTEASSYTPVDTDLNKEFHFNVSEAEAARADDCRCKNGKCMRVCDVEKITPCTDERKVCVCGPEFGKKGEGVCEYCDCGIGFGCTFKYWTYRDYWEKRCKCPEGYYEDTQINRCRATCSDERPCQNGGTCTKEMIFSQVWTCSCPIDTSGGLCEEIDCSECRNRLEVDCLYDQGKHTSYCSCKNSSLYYDYGKQICIPCPCGNGNCEYDSRRKLKCNCHSGYAEFNGYCKKCECDIRAFPGCNFDSKGERICRCPDGYYERNGNCLLCGCDTWNGFNMKCEMIGNVKRCYCQEGYQDVLGQCEDINECETNNTCHPSAVCSNSPGDFYCKCPDGYKGSKSKNFKAMYVEPGEACEDINECEEKLDFCWYRDNMKCVNLPGSYKCACLPGYEPRSYLEEPSSTSCVKVRGNWVPAVIVICSSIVLIAASLFMHARLKNRAASSN